MLHFTMLHRVPIGEKMLMATDTLSYRNGFKGPSEAAAYGQIARPSSPKYQMFLLTPYLENVLTPF